jgi:hypothetical protein
MDKTELIEVTAIMVTCRLTWPQLLELERRGVFCRADPLGNHWFKADAERYQHAMRMMLDRT